MNGPEFSLEHAGVAARDSRALADWYRTALGATTLWTNDANPPAFLLALPGGGIVEVYPSTEPATEAAPNGRQGLRHLALKVVSIEKARTHLETAGIVFSDPVKPAGGGGRVLFFEDPEGNLLHLVERPVHGGEGR